MITTIIFTSNDGKKYRVAVEGDLRNITLNAERRRKLGTRICKILVARGLKSAKSGGIFYLYPPEARLELTPDHGPSELIKGTVSYSTLVDEGLAPNVIRDWR
jgi:hypothetical protein